MVKSIKVDILPDGSASVFPSPPDGLRASIIDRDSIEAEVLRRLADRVLSQEVS